jgi:hypothetical protein
METVFGFQDVFGQHCRPVAVSSDGFVFMEFLSGKVEARDPLELHVSLNPVKKKLEYN